MSRAVYTICCCCCTACLKGNRFLAPLDNKLQNWLGGGKDSRDMNRIQAEFEAEQAGPSAGQYLRAATQFNRRVLGAQRTRMLRSACLFIPLQIVAMAIFLVIAFSPVLNMEVTVAGVTASSGSSSPSTFVEAVSLLSMGVVPAIAASSQGTANQGQAGDFSIDSTVSDARESAATAATFQSSITATMVDTGAITTKLTLWPTRMRIEGIASTGSTIARWNIQPLFSTASTQLPSPISVENDAGSSSSTGSSQLPHIAEFKQLCITNVAQSTEPLASLTPFLWIQQLQCSWGMGFVGCNAAVAILAVFNTLYYIWLVIKAGDSVKGVKLVFSSLAMIGLCAIETAILIQGPDDGYRRYAVRFYKHFANELTTIDNGIQVSTSHSVPASVNTLLAVGYLVLILASVLQCAVVRITGKLDGYSGAPITRRLESTGGQANFELQVIDPHSGVV